MNGTDLVEKVKLKLEREKNADVNNKEIAEVLGLTEQGLNNWRNRSRVTVRQMVGLLFRVRKKSTEQTENQAIRPIVEFFKLARVESRGGVNYEIFSVNDGHPHLHGLQTELNKNHGVYIFYDSRGRALYAGKTRKQTLWNEINKAYNRHRTVQQIRRVNHPKSRVQYRTSDEKRRQITLRTLPLYELAAYISAYQVSDGLIKVLEALIIRSFANDLLNVRMENFS
jgi:hypothetical protein